MTADLWDLTSQSYRVHCCELALTNKRG